MELTIEQRNQRPTASGIYILRKLVDVIQNKLNYKVGKTDNIAKRLQASEYRGAEFLFFKATSGLRSARIIEKEVLEKFTKLYGQPVEGREVFSGDLSEMINIIIHSSNTIGLVNVEDVTRSMEKCELQFDGERRVNDIDHWNVIHPSQRDAMLFKNMKTNFHQYGYDPNNDSVNKQLGVYLQTHHGFATSDCKPFMKEVSSCQFRFRNFPRLLYKKHRELNGSEPQWLNRKKIVSDKE